jgi:hypothetical protein
VTVLFVIMAISVISLGLFARTDMNLACGRNLSLKIQTDSLAHSGLQCGRAMVLGPSSPVPLDPWSGPVVFDGLDASLHCELTIGIAVETAAADPNDSTYLYPVMCRAYKQAGADVQAESIVYGSLFHDPNEARAYYISIHR